MRASVNVRLATSYRGEPVFRQTLRREDLGKPPNFVLCGSSPVNLAAGEFCSQIIAA